MKKWKLAIIMLVVALLLAACGSKEEATESANENAATQEKAKEKNATEESGPVYPMTVSPTIASTESEDKGTVTFEDVTFETKPEKLVGTSRRTRAPGGRSTPSPTVSIADRCRCPFARPSCPSSPSRTKTLPDRRRLGLRAKWDGFRAIAFVDGDKVHLQSRNGKPLTPLLPRAGVPRGPLRARRRDRAVRRAGPPGLRRARPAHPPRRSRGSTCSPRRRRRASSPSTCSRDDDETLLELPQRERRDRLEAAASRSPSTSRPRSEDPAEAAALAAGRRGRDRQAPGRAVPAGRARRHGEDQARAHDRRGRASAGGRARRRARSARSSSALYDDDGQLREVGHTSGFTAKREARAAGVARAVRDRRARHAASRAAGTTSASSSGSRCGPSWWSR